ncbi:hypothetical protein [Schumannella luteola]|jgi:hypothetical protein
MDDEASARCSRAGCRADASWSIGWRNPRIHAADRVKLWAACDEHRGFLEDYLVTRGFPVVVAPAGTEIPVVPDGAGA